VKELLTALAAAAAALATLCALFVTDGDLRAAQEKAREEGASIPGSLKVAQSRLKSRKFLSVIIPSFAAFALSLAAIFVSSGGCDVSCHPGTPTVMVTPTVIVTPTVNVTVIVTLPPVMDSPPTEPGQG
jgi:hypothetical protein